jgi:GrpB-like predicted nucleotidyltransferase (UPF0157 family)
VAGAVSVVDCTAVAVSHNSETGKGRRVRRIRDTLGSGALAVEHVGSTAVPGLAAKNRIDIDLIAP